MPKDRHFLLVEDDPRDVELILNALLEAGETAEVTVLHNGQEALDYLDRRGEFRLRRPQPPSLLLLDVKMPKVGGLEVVRALRADEGMRGIAVVLITSSRQEKDMLAAYKLQLDGYLVKPVGAQQLAATIESALHAAAGRAS